MNTVNDMSLKRTYSTPQIERIKLDNEISLALESDPAEGPGESFAPDYFREDPFNTHLV